VKVVTQPFFDTGVSPPAVDLCVSGQTRPDKMANVVAGMFLPEVAREFGTFGSGSDKTHVAAQNVPELRKFVEAEPAKIMAHAGAARVVRDRPDSAEMALRIRIHATEFNDRKTVTIQADASLAIKYGSTIGQAHDGRNQRHDRREDQ